MRIIIAILAVLAAVPGAAQTPAATLGPATETSGSVTTGVQQVDNSTNSSKFTEYRDLKDTFYVPRIVFSINDPGRGVSFDLRAANVSRDDQTIFAEGGRSGVWRAGVTWVEVPHHYSTRAVTPYIRRAAGLFELPATIPITFKKLATAAGDTASVLASDELIAQYQRTFLAPTPLGTQTNMGRFFVDWSGSDLFSIGVGYNLIDKTGTKATFGPIGDRPPRTLNMQLTEPVDYRTNELTLAAEHDGGSYQLRGEYLFSDFANQVDTLRWQNAYTTVTPGQTYDLWDRSVSVYGVRPLAPDNRYHHLSATFGADLPHDSRLTVSAAYGHLAQNETLLAYSYNVDQLANQTLPRATADALIKTTHLAADYVVAPMPRLNLRAFYRLNNMDNQTPSSRWQYVTSDTSNLNGTVSYVNKRVSLPYASDRQNLGLDATWRLPARSSLSLGYEREGIDRVDREADTDEDRLRATWRLRAARWGSFEARYLFGRRDGGVYDNEVTHDGYWYAPGDANDNNNPLLTFDNHPDMRRYDVSDRQRHELHFRFNLTRADAVALSLFMRYRNDDFDSGVTSSQPLLGTGLADEAASSPGDQLGRLEDVRTRYGVDFFAQPNSRLTFNAFLNYDLGSASDRSLEFNENNKANPSAVATAELGPWTRRGSQWTADIDDRTWTTGLGATLQVVPDRLTLLADYTTSLASIDIAYGGYGTTNWDGTPFPPNHQFAFSSPPQITENLHTLSVRGEIPIRALMLVAGYSYERYTVEDWQQGATAPWVEPVGADMLLRDTSRSFQWGNRLFNLGTYLAPSYDAHLGFLGLRYRF